MSIWDHTATHRLPRRHHRRDLDGLVQNHPGGAPRHGPGSEHVARVRHDLHRRVRRRRQPDDRARRADHDAAVHRRLARDSRRDLKALLLISVLPTGLGIAWFLMIGGRLIDLASALLSTAVTGLVSTLEPFLPLAVSIGALWLMISGGRKTS